MSKKDQDICTPLRGVLLTRRVSAVSNVTRINILVGFILVHWRNERYIMVKHGVGRVFLGGSFNLERISFLEHTKNEIYQDGAAWVDPGFARGERSEPL